MLAALHAANGAPLGRHVLTDLLYPDAETRPASAPFACDAVASRLRKAGHPVVAQRGAGYRLAGVRS